MNVQKDYFYTKSHEWVQFLSESTARVGLSDYAQSEMSDIVFVNLPQEGDLVSVGDSFADVESVKAVSDVYSPLAGEVSAVNEELLDSPQKINEDPYGAWLAEIKDISGKEELMDAAEYEKFLAESAE
ncbi:MAG: glycine cleavage system protein GcvH [Clostridiales bacterium]|uniref:Glycine cleavage system H protein n=1 Tax=Harryflintia acetispora TaxID=1849041 RepID=A0A9X8UIQ1_9FIRM|nr:MULTISPECIES: glycine cleavage system protein GcvH [Oscillospiraceae]PWM36285.1 MAG: glycine cleavage system protein GcvH [Clostridiales bacterium]RGB67252.1 glycine cleavage system protein GcvH [Harryflintia acetispora]TCL43167.1 glycine cleavage system H protein [Harryflintia acetispora]